MAGSVFVMKICTKRVLQFLYSPSKAFAVSDSLFLWLHPLSFGKKKTILVKHIKVSSRSSVTLSVCDGVVASV